MNLEHSLNLIKEHAEQDRSAVLLSFGKDSIVMADLIRKALPSHKFPLPVIWHRHPWFTHKNRFGEETATKWGMELHDWLPMHAGVKVKDDMLELVNRYKFGVGFMDLPINVLEPISRRPFVCGLKDWLFRPKSPRTEHPWRTLFHGHKSSDVDPFEGHVPLKADTALAGGIKLVFPLKDWTDEDIWNHIEEHHLPFQKDRYENRVELKDKWNNPDYIHACTACIDPRNQAASVYCPMLRIEVPNVGANVLQLHAQPDYIEREKVA